MKNFLLLLLIAITPLTSLRAQNDAKRIREYNIKKNVALEGYDPVSYFDNKPLEGNEQIHTTYKGITYHFATVQNQKKFMSNPDRYEPAYGGWCAYAMGDSGEKVKIDPETFKIIDDRLYLFYNFWGNNTLKTWNAQEKKLKEAADRSWNKFVQ